MTISFAAKYRPLLQATHAVIVLPFAVYLMGLSLNTGTMVVLDLLRGDGFPDAKARSELRVPVFSFRDRIGSREDS